MPLVRFTVADGGSTLIPLLVGTASFVQDLGYGITARRLGAHYRPFTQRRPEGANGPVRRFRSSASRRSGQYEPRISAATAGSLIVADARENGGIPAASSADADQCRLARLARSDLHRP